MFFVLGDFLMLKKLHFSLFSCVMFLTSPSQSAIIIAGDLTDDEQEKAYAVLQTYAGPSPKYFKKDFEGPENPDVHNILMNRDIPFAEVEFLKNHFERENLKLDVAYIPATIWDLHVINNYLTNRRERTYYESTSFPKVNNFHAYDKNRRERYFRVSNELMRTLKDQNERDASYFISLSTTYLQHIDQNKYSETPLSRALVDELRKIEDNSPSILHKMIYEEMEAAEKNQILLTRATSGVTLKSELGPTRKEIRESLSQHYDSDTEVEELIDKIYETPQWYQDDNLTAHALDFPAKGPSAWKAIHNLQQDIKENKSIQGMDFSYASSVLSGYLFDSFNQKKGACTFAFFHQKPEMTVYTLHLDKKWFFSRGHFLFHLPSLETDGIFGSGEKFHPRLRSILSSSPSSFNNISWGACPSSCFEINVNFLPPALGELTPVREESMKIFQYIFEANEVISQARVVSFKGEIVDHDRYPSEVTEVLNNQKELSTLLQTKIGNIL